MEVATPITFGSQGDRSRSVVVVVAVLLAAFLTAFDLRMKSVGISDLRGAFGLSVDESSWLCTFASAPQVLVAPCVAWLVVVFGIKRVLIAPTIIYTALSIVIPLFRNFEVLVILHAARAVLLGLFVPATLMTAFRNLDSKYWIVALAFYVARIPISQNLGIYTTGSYSQTIGWQWLYWQDALIASSIGVLLWFGAKSTEIDHNLLKRADWGGIAVFGVALTMLYVALDQGNRLDWFRSGFVATMLAGSAFLGLVFLSHESLTKRPWAHFSVMYSRNIALSFLAIFAFMVSSLASSLLAPNFLISVARLRPEQIGNFSAPVSIAVLIFATFVAVILVREVGPRITMIIGFTLFALSSWFGTSLSSLWSLPEFELIAGLQTIAEEVTFLAAVVMIVSSIDPARAVAVSAYIQMLRLICSELALAIMTTFVRQREQVHSHLIGLHVAHASPDVNVIIARLGSGDGVGTLEAARRGVYLLASHVQREAIVLAYIDGFWLAFSAAVVGLCAVALMVRSPPHPLWHR